MLHYQCNPLTVARRIHTRRTEAIQSGFSQQTKAGARKYNQYSNLVRWFHQAPKWARCSGTLSTQHSGIQLRDASPRTNCHDKVRTDDNYSQASGSLQVTSDL